jgi:hypothetical protein
VAVSGAMMKNKSSGKIHDRGDFFDDEYAPYDDGFDTDDNDRDAAGVDGGFRSDSDEEGDEDPQYRMVRDTHVFCGESRLLGFLTRKIGMEFADSVAVGIHYDHLRNFFVESTADLDAEVYCWAHFRSDKTEAVTTSMYWRDVLQTCFGVVRLQSDPNEVGIKTYLIHFNESYWKHNFEHTCAFQVQRIESSQKLQIWVFHELKGEYRNFVLVMQPDNIPH